MQGAIKRGQASTEALMIIGIAVVLIFLLIYSILPVIFDFGKFSDSVMAERSMSRIAGAVEAVSAYGPGTSITMYVYFPAGEIYYDSPSQLVFKLKDGTSVVRVLNTNLKTDSINFDTGGIKTVRVSYDTTVNLKVE